MMRRKLISTILLLTLSLGFARQMPPVKFSKLGLASGLSNGDVSCIYQDRLGYLWFGTEDGLNRYDGYEFKVFRHSGNSSSLSNDRIFSIIEGQNGDLWIGTYHGLNRYDRTRNTFETFLLDEQDDRTLPGDIIYALHEDRSGDIWVGTQLGLAVYDSQKKSIKRISGNQALQSRINCIEEDPAGNIWIGTDLGLLKQQEDGSFMNYTAQGLTSDNRVMSLLFDDEQKMWVGHFNAGLSVVDLSKMTTKMYQHQSENPQSIPDNYIYHISQNQKGEIWLATDNGLALYQGDDRFYSYYSNEADEYSLSSNITRYVFFDEQQRMWISTRLGGICYYDRAVHQFNHVKSNAYDLKGLSGNKISGYAEGPDGIVAICTDGSGVNFFDPNKNTFARLNKTNSDLSSDKALALQYTAEGLWIGTWAAGLNLYSTHTGKVKTFRHDPKDLNSISDDNIYELFLDRNDDLWIGTWGNGLCRYDQDKDHFIRYTHDPDNPDSFGGSAINQITQDKEGLIYIVTEFKGLQIFDPVSEKFKHYLADDQPGSISINALMSILIDSKERIWVGTNGGGLNLFDKQTGLFETIGIDQGLPNNVVVGILEDDDGHLWLGTNRGISEFDPDTRTFTNYSKEDGLQDYQFMPRNSIKLSDGTMMFGGNNGFNYFDPGALFKNNIVPPVYITDVSLFYEPIPIEDHADGILQKHVMFTDELVFTFDQNFFSFQYTAINYTQPKQNQYSYQMEGLHDRWIQAGTDRIVSFTGLDPGDYIFKVKASNNDGLWNEEPASIKLTILPPWWKTNWAILGYSIFIALVLYAFRNLIMMRTNYMNNLRMERHEKESIEKLNKAKLQFFTNISHEFRTPLTLIQGPVEQLLASVEGGKKLKDQLRVINSNTQRLLRLVNQLLDFRKVETGNIELKVAEGNMVKFTREIMLSFDHLAEEKQIEFGIIASSNVLNVHFDRDQLEKVIFNLLSNAFKYTPNKGKIEIRIVDLPDQIRLEVEDSGEGIVDSNLDKIFNRFYSDQGLTKNGTGIGLALAKNLVELHHGTIDVNSEVGKGSTFKVCLKKGTGHFSKDQLLNDFKDSEYIGHYLSFNDETTAPIQHDEERNLADLDKLLVVEDNPEIRNLIKSLFIAEYIVLEAENGKEGLQLAEEEIPDLIISDVMMPVMDGIKLCKKIKSSLTTSHIPVILLTARTSLVFKVEGLENGADDYITKPFNAKVLGLKVRNLITSRKQLRKIFQDQENLHIEPKSISFTSTDEQFIQSALDSIEANMSNSDYGVEDFGRDVGLSRMQLYRKLKSMTGQSANEFIRSIRLKRAAQLLGHSGHTIAEVTYMVGFSDLQYFRKCFKKEFGVNPSEYTQGDMKEVDL